MEIALAHFSLTARRYGEFLQQAFPQRRLLAEDELLPRLPHERPELEWQSRWFAGELGREFTSTDGKSVRIVQFGHWNHGPGPDFQECAVEVDGRLLRGCIELDPDERDWEHHGHSQNPTYDAVVLHVFLRRGDSAFFTRNSRHQAIVQVLLEPGPLSPEPPTPPQAKPGRCHAKLQLWENARISSLLTSAARFRLERKHLRFKRTVESHSRPQAFFQGFAECLGYSRNKLPMTVLAQQFPLAELQRNPDQREGWLFGAAGFLEGVHFDAADTTTRSYMRRLWETWWKHRAQWKEKPVSQPMPWAAGSGRPGNHPQRRVAALSEIAANWKSIAPQLQADKFRQKDLCRVLENLSHDYWDHHYTLTSQPSAGRLAILGKSRSSEILANLIYPALVPENEALWESYCSLPAKLDNEKTRLASLRLFGETEKAASFSKKIFHQQALLQIFEDFCLVDASDCASCPFPEQLEQWP